MKPFKVVVHLIGVKETKPKKPENFPAIPRKGDVLILADRSTVIVEMVEIYSKDLGLNFDAKVAVKLAKN